MAKENPNPGPATAPSKIMTKPLPAILDEIEDSIRAADAAAKDARSAAEEARRAGEKAASEAARVAAEAIGKVEQVANEALRLSRLLESTLMQAATGIEKRLAEKK
ncbi:MAG: hypothetical protein HYX79_07745 [Chloroflexi bacterium]|nr:hypothetical protein [Chloroflexota bacterium]